MQKKEVKKRKVGLFVSPSHLIIYYNNFCRALHFIQFFSLSSGCHDERVSFPITSINCRETQSTAAALSEVDELQSISCTDEGKDTTDLIVTKKLHFMTCKFHFPREARN